MRAPAHRIAPVRHVEQLNRVEPVEIDRAADTNARLDRIEADIRAVLAAGAAYQLERRLARILSDNDALGDSQPPTQGTSRNA